MKPKALEGTPAPNARGPEEDRGRPTRSRTRVALLGTIMVGALAAGSVAIAVASGSGLGAPDPEGQAGAAAEAMGEHQATAEEIAAIDAALTSTAPALPSGMPTARPSELGKPLDAPSLEEFGYARSLASAAESEGSMRVDGSAGYEFLSLDVAEDVPPGERVLEIQSYDYSTLELVSQRVDLIGGTVQEQRATNARPSPSEREGVFAMDLLIQSDASAEVKEKFFEITGEQLTSPAQLDYVPASNVPALALRSVPDCEWARCITFQGRSQDGVWLAMNRLVVNLTDRTVHTLS